MVACVRATLVLLRLVCVPSLPGTRNFRPAYTINLSHVLDGDVQGKS